MNQSIYDALLAAAKRGKTLTYADIAPLADLDMRRPDHRARISEILEEISRSEHDEGRPLLSALVVHGSGDEAGAPGKGFFTLARQLGLLTTEDDTAFFAEELTRLFGHWSAEHRR